MMNDQYLIRKSKWFKEYFSTIPKNNKFAMKFNKEFARSVDSFGYISTDLGNYLEQLFNDKRYVIGLHCTGFTVIDNDNPKDFIDKYFDNGLVNLGDIMQGAHTPKPYLDKTVVFTENYLVFIRNLKFSYSYKNSAGAIILRIPKEYYEKEDENMENLYDYKNNQFYIKPEYIIGYVPNENGHLGKMYTREDYLNENENKKRR